MSRIMVPILLILTTVGWATETDTDTCDSQASSEQKGRALLQISASSRTQGMQPATSGLTASLDQAGYATIAKLCCSQEMKAYIKRVIDREGWGLCHAGGLSGFTLFYDCNDDGQTYLSLLKGLTESFKDDCPFLAASPGTCKPKDPKCPEYPGGTFPPCMGASTTTPPGTTAPPSTTTPPGTTAPPSTTTPPGTTAPGTTSSPGGCLGPKMDIFMAIDASQSVERRGWAAQTKFAGELVDKLLGSGNPQGHRINAHWFNGITSPLIPAQVKEPTGGDKKQDDPSLNPNDIGTFVSTPTKVINGIEALDYRDIRFGATDHPQVYLTADFAYKKTPSTTNNKKIVILITDGETHNGDKCGDLEKNPGKNEVYKVIKNCDANSNHPCRRTDPTKKSCDFKKCVCGMYKAEEFKKKGYTLVVVAIQNGNHATLFEAQMKEMASPDRLYFAKDFNALSTLAADIQTDLCAS